MKATVEELTHKVADLPPDFAEHVLSWEGNLARVKSFSSDTVYDVSILMGIGEGERRITCTCPSVKLCKHAVAFFAVAKHLKPDKPIQGTGEADEDKETASKETTDGLKLIAGAIEQLVDGIGLIVIERVKEEIGSHAKDETS